MDSNKVALTILILIVMTTSATLPSTDETTKLHTEEPLFLRDNSKDRTKDSNTNSAFTTVLKFTPGSMVSGWTTDMKQENTTHMPKKNELSTRDTDTMERTTSYLALDHDMKTRKSDVTQSTHDSDDVASGSIPSAHSEVFLSTIISNNKNMIEHTKALDSLGTSVSTRKPQIASNDVAKNTELSTSAFLDKRPSPYDTPVSDESTINFPYITQELDKFIAASTTVTTHKATTHKEMRISANTAVSDRTTHDLPGATKVIETTRKNDPFLTVEANATTSALTTVSTSTIKAITVATPTIVNPKPTTVKVTTPSAVQTKPSTIKVTTPSTVNSKPESKPVTTSSALELKSTLLTMTTPSTVKLKSTTIKMTTPSAGKTNPATVKMTSHSVVKQEPATTMVTTSSTVKPKQTSELKTTFSTLKSTRTTMMMTTPSAINSKPTSKMVTTLSSVQPKTSTVKVITPSKVQTKQAAITATTPSTPEQKTTSITVTTPSTVKSKPTTIMVTKHSTEKPKSTTIIMTTTLKPVAEATTPVEMNAPTHNLTFEEHISHTTVKSGVTNNKFSLGVTSTIGYSEENNETESENRTTPLSTEAIETSNTTVSPASNTMLLILQWATGFTQARKPGVTSNPLQDPDKLQIQQPTLNPFLNDDTYWPVAMALTIGIPSIIVFAVTITVLHRMRKSKFMGPNMYKTL